MDAQNFADLYSAAFSKHPNQISQKRLRELMQWALFTLVQQECKIMILTQEACRPKGGDHG